MSLLLHLNCFLLLSFQGILLMHVYFCFSLFYIFWMQLFILTFFFFFNTTVLTHTFGHHHNCCMKPECNNQAPLHLSICISADKCSADIPYSLYTWTPNISHKHLGTYFYDITTKGIRFFWCICIAIMYYISPYSTIKW